MKKSITLQSCTTAQKAYLTNVSKSFFVNFTVDTRCHSKQVQHKTHVSIYALDYFVLVYSKTKSSYIISAND